MSRVGNATAEKYIYLFVSPLTSPPRLPCLYTYTVQLLYYFLSFSFTWIFVSKQYVSVCVCVYTRGRAFRFLRWIPGDFFFYTPRAAKFVETFQEFQNLYETFSLLSADRKNEKKIANFSGKCRAWVFIVPLALFNFAKICTRFNIIHNYHGILFRWSFLRYKHLDIF